VQVQKKARRKNEKAKKEKKVTGYQAVKYERELCQA
jgi:hypothetical protein